MANESNATSDAATDAETDVHRLRDILVEEVSLVDRAANKRRFLVVKRSNDISDDGKRGPRKTDDETTTPATRGRSKQKPRPAPEIDKARRRAAAAAADEDEDDEEMEKAGRRPPPWEKDDEDETKEDDEEEEDEVDDEETEKADEEDDDEDKDDNEDEDDESEDDDAAAGNARPSARFAGGRPDAGKGGRAKSAEKADDGLVMSAAAKTTALRVLAKALERLMGVANCFQKADADDNAKASVPGAVPDELEAIGKLLEDVAERLPVAKAGRRMAKDRLDRFQKALALLSDVLKELTNASQAAESGDSSAANNVQKRTSTPGIGALVTSVTELTQILKGQQDELVRLRKTRATSNAIPVDGARRAASQDVSWPLDMNRPISRDGVAKAISFYDE